MYDLHDFILFLARPRRPQSVWIRWLMRATQRMFVTSRLSMAYQDWWWDKRYALETLGKDPRGYWRCWLDLSKYY